MELALTPCRHREGRAPMYTARIVALLAAFSCVASAARAQYPQRRDGFWVGFGLGYGSANIKCDQCVDSSGVGGVTGFVKLGGTPSRNVLIGGAINVWAHSDGTGNTETMSNVTASVYLYPQARSGFFLTGGLGFSNYYVNSSPSFDGTGWGFTAGAGYDIRVGRDVSLTPVVHYVYGGVGDHGAQVGLGFVGLRQGESRAAADHFLGAVRSNAGDAEAWYGLGLARVRLGQRTAAAEAWRRTLRLAPGYEDAELQLLALGIDSGLARRPVVRPVDPDVAARTAGDGFEIRSTSGWRPFYVKGINLGVALPGHFPSDFPTDDSTYGRWLELIAGARANAVRVYTILPPAFYRSLKAWNDAHPDRALWLLHGVWTELPPGDDYDAASWKAAFRAEMRRVVDLVHGHGLIAARPGHAFGRYDSDVSDHVLGFIIGREWEPSSIRAYNARRRDRTAFAGRFLALDRGTPADVWMAEQCDYLLTYEWDTYHAQRPIAYTNWPTLDPLSHPTEPTLEEEQRLRRRYGFPPNPRLKEYDNDRESLDAMLVRATPANLAGYFASYHAYPYYPDFIDLDSAYGTGSAEGRSRYFGYLRALKQHHAGRPLLIAEYGVPSSRGVSHLQTDGLGHGGHDEREMAEIDARLTREVRAAGAAGGVLFAWLDEWFKHTWVTIGLEVPAERDRLGQHMEDAEQQ